MIWASISEIRDLGKINPEIKFWSENMNDDFGVHIDNSFGEISVAVYENNNS